MKEIQVDASWFHQLLKGGCFHITLTAVGAATQLNKQGGVLHIKLR